MVILRCTAYTNMPSSPRYVLHGRTVLENEQRRYQDRQHDAFKEQPGVETPEGFKVQCPVPPRVKMDLDRQTQPHQYSGQTLDAERSDCD